MRTTIFPLLHGLYGLIIIIIIFIIPLSSFVVVVVHGLSSELPPSPPRRVVAVVGGGLSGLVVGHVLQQSGRYTKVQILEASPRVGGNVRSMPDPRHQPSSSSSSGAALLNVGHTTHLGMFWNLRLLLRHLNVTEIAVGRGPNDTPGMFGMLSVTTENGRKCQPSLEDVLSPLVWWEAFRLYYHSYMEPTRRLDDFFRQHSFSRAFRNILYWSLRTFEFDKELEEMGEYALGTARALLVTQVFFKFLLMSDAFQGVLPGKLQEGLWDDLVHRVQRACRRCSIKCDATDLLSYDRLLNLMKDFKTDPLASYYTANYGQAMERLAEGAGEVVTSCQVTCVTRNANHSSSICLETTRGQSFWADAVVFTVQPSVLREILSTEDFPEHCSALRQMDSGAVGVRIVHANDLPFAYPPGANQPEEDPSSTFDPLPSPILGIFDISELTVSNQATTHNQVPLSTSNQRTAGWLSVAYPVYPEQHRNRHQAWLQNIPCADETVYPWTRATPSFVKARNEVVQLQGCHGVFVTGHTLTGVNKASELQVTHALKVCHDYFHVLPPWGDFFPTPLLPDCNDDDAFRRASTPWEACRLAWKNLVGSFLLVGVVAKVGVKALE